SHTNGHGYIQFDINEGQEQLTTDVSKQLDERSNLKKITVNEVLSSLFPDGFSNIFRFIGSETDTKMSSEAPKAIASTTEKAIRETIVAKPSSPSSSPSSPSKNGTYYSYQTTVTKEYRREVRPGHTQIVVENISSPEQKSLRESSNEISRNDLLLINRAAVTSPVLPSLLLPPENEDNETLVAAESAPIVILGEQEVDLDDIENIEDNQIAETQYIGETQLYQHPPQTESSVHPVGSYSHQHQEGPAKNQNFNVHIAHNMTPVKNEDSSKSQPQQTLPNYQDQEAPSRQFLKTFKPMVSGSADGPISKGVFHYESGNPPQRPNLKQSKEVNYKNHEQSNLKSINSQLNTKAIASHSADGVTPQPLTIDSNYNGPTPNSVLYITVNSHNSAKESHDIDEAEQHLLSRPHDYVSEAAAESSQKNLQHVISPKANPNANTNPDTQLPVKPNGYTFVEVQKSVNIHNKLITEKDGQLVEMHETIYNPTPYQQSYSPSEYVSAATPDVKPAPPPKNYDSLATHPINVEHLEYENFPQESASTVALNAIPHSSTVEVVEKIIDRPVQEIVEKHIPVPYAVPQPVAVPVHFEHYVDRPYPVETIVEHPVPYPVETIVEKIVEKQVPVEVERIVEKPVEKIVEKYVDRPMAIPIHVPVAIHMPMPPSHPNFGSHPNALQQWSHPSIAHIPPKVLQNYYTRMLKKLLPHFSSPHKVAVSPATKPALKTIAKPPTNPVHGDAPKVATFSLADMRFDLRPPPPPSGSAWLQGARYIYNTLPADLATSAASAPVHMVKSYIGPVPTTSTSHENSGNDFDEFQRWRSGHSLKRSPDFSRSLHMEYGFKPPLVPSVEIDDKGMPLKQPDSEVQ
ncbi:hypothetical protein KR044_010286, partial [Drosophila immigrans]